MSNKPLHSFQEYNFRIMRVFHEQRYIKEQNKDPGGRQKAKDVSPILVFILGTSRVIRSLVWVWLELIKDCIIRYTDLTCMVFWCILTSLFKSSSGNICCSCSFIPLFLWYGSLNSSVCRKWSQLDVGLKFGLKEAHSGKSHQRANSLQKQRRLRLYWRTILMQGFILISAKTSSNKSALVFYTCFSEKFQKKYL